MIPQDLLELMKSVGLFPTVLATTDGEGKPHLTFITWVHPIDEKTLRLALSSNAKSTKNMVQNGKACLMLIAQGKALSCYGTVRLIRDRLEEVKFPVSLFEMQVETVDNNLFPGGTTVGTIPFMHTGNLGSAGELDQLVLNALKS